MVENIFPEANGEKHNTYDDDGGGGKIHVHISHDLRVRSQEVKKESSCSSSSMGKWESPVGRAAIPVPGSIWMNNHLAMERIELNGCEKSETIGAWFIVWQTTPRVDIGWKCF